METLHVDMDGFEPPILKKNTVFRVGHIKPGIANDCKTKLHTITNNFYDTGAQNLYHICGMVNLYSFALVY